jgi:integrative and conjugative element protein (TIGR02256 family)
MRPRISSLLLLPANAMAAILEEVLTWVPAETGGIIMGRSDASSGVAEVTAILGGGPGAVRKESSFEPDQVWQEEKVARVYRDSGRRVSYLGDWHSHPGGSVMLSSTDKKAGRLIATSQMARCPHPLLVVVGVRAGKVEYGAFAWGRKRFRRVRVTATTQFKAAVIL